MTTPTAVMDLEGKVALRTDEALRKEVRNASRPHRRT